MHERLLAAGLFLAAIAILAPQSVASAEGAATAVEGDSLVVDLPELVVITAGRKPVPRQDRTVLSGPDIEAADPVSLADLGVRLPSARIAINSRGDAHAMVRGAPERHVQTYLDGIPLNLPWDERVDLETVPAVAVGAVEGRRGPAALLDGPGALAGSLRLLPPMPTEDPLTRLGVGFGAHGAGRTHALHQRRSGAWNLLGAGAWHRRDAVSRPGGGNRANSDLEQWSVLLRGARPVRGTGRLSLLATAWSTEKGVAPELDLPAGDVRHWRYPVRERLLAGGVLDLPLCDDGVWSLGAALSADIHRQEIDPRGPDRWDEPLLQGEDYEKSWDRTGYGRLRLTRWLGATASVAVQGSARYGRHRESILVGGPVRAYAQWLTSLAAEGEWWPAAGWILRGGLGWDRSATPETGDFTAGDAANATAANLRFMREVGERTTVHAAVSRRSRFPSLRESYSGALGKFEPNPDLRPERQDQAELGASRRGDSWRAEAVAFVGLLDDGIEKESTGPGTFRRVNRTEIRVPGLELVGSWDLRRDLTLRLQHTILAARVQEDGAFDAAAEDRPDYQSFVAVDWRRAQGPGAAVETRVTGPRWSADGTAPVGLTRLPAGVTWHARLSWRWLRTPGTTSEVTAHLRLDNILDARVDGQVGLPGPGRTLSGGVSIGL
ncbi:MAG: TonB-dependent receptor [bacterium]|nr:TonB-dependent receptor [bacterium]